MSSWRNPYWIGPVRAEEPETNKALNTADDEFIDMMIPHHEKAIVVAKDELAKGKNPVLLKMAKAIVSGQGSQIAEMDKLKKLDT